MRAYHIFYTKDMREYQFKKMLTKEDVQNYGYILSGEAADKEAVFMHMQGEVWSPNGEARDLISKSGTHHTSMSVGDVLIEDGIPFLCAGEGWIELPRELAGDFYGIMV